MVSKKKSYKNSLIKNKRRSKINGGKPPKAATKSATKAAVEHTQQSVAAPVVAVVNKRPENGEGSFTYSDGKYTGQWTNSKEHGWGKMEYTSGGVYEGNFSNGKKEGTGVQRWANGDSYVGTYKNDQQNGKGVYTWVSGTSYDGYWKNNNMDGKGVYTWANGNSYNGDFKNNLRDGRGVFTYVDVESYDGLWKKDKKEGKGVLTLANGYSYIASYKNDFRHGKGVEMCANGDSYDGNWKNDLKHGRGINTKANNEVFIETWVQGDRQTQEKIAQKSTSKHPGSAVVAQIEIPIEYICPISLEIMRDPVITADGQTYERVQIEEWFDRGVNTSPKTGSVLPNTNLIPNIALRNVIEEFCKQHHGLC